jgi:hypothetical protein
LNGESSAEKVMGVANAGVDGVIANFGNEFMNSICPKITTRFNVIYNQKIEWIFF